MKYSIQWLREKVKSGEQPKYIFFWGHSDKNSDRNGKYVFSQWYESPFEVDGVVYKTTEHWMMSKKALLFGDSETNSKILISTKPSEAKALGRKVAGYDDELWNSHKFEIVITGNFHKFSQDAKLGEYLIATENSVIVEASPADAIWGIGMAQDHRNILNPELWRGENLLGFALMEVRDLLKEMN